MTYHERKARQLGLDFNEDEIRLLFYVWSSSSKDAYSDFMRSGTCFAKGYFLMISQKLEVGGYFEADPNAQAAVKLTQRGLDVFYALQK